MRSTLARVQAGPTSVNRTLWLLGPVLTLALLPSNVVAMALPVAAARPGGGLLVSLYVSAFYLDSSLSLWATGALLGLTDWRGASLVLGGLSALGVPLGLLAARGAPAPEGKAAVLRPRVLRHQRLLRTILAYSGHSFELYVSRAWLASFLAAILVGAGVASGEAAAEGGKWAALMGGIGTSGVWLGGWLSDR